MNYNYKSYNSSLNKIQSEKPKVVIPKDYWSYEKDNQPERLSASRNQTYYGGISEEEEKRNQKNTRYMSNNYDKDYYDQNKMQSQYATTQQQNDREIKDKETNTNKQKQNNNEEQEKHKIDKQQKNQERETYQENTRANNRERKKYSPSNRQYNNGQYRTRSYSSNSISSRNSYNANNRNRSNNQNNLEEDINKQKFCIQINTTREMTINEIREYIKKKSNQLEEQEINNIEINIAVKDGRKIQQEIQNIINTSLIEIEKEKEIINQTQASLITTEEILKQFSSEEFISIRQAFTEINKEQEYQNERAREYHLKQLEKLKQIKEKQNKEMEVEENLIRVSQNMPIFKPQIQQNQFINFQQIDNTEIKNSRNKLPIENISEEDKVNKPQTSSEERQMIESPKQKKKIVPWANMLVDTSVAILKDKQDIIIDSFKIVNQAITDQKICFSKINTKQMYKEYLTKHNVETNKDVKDIPTGIYLILIIEAQYINDAKKIARERDKEEGFEVHLQAFTEAIATYALGTLPFTVETDKIKLSASRQYISSALNGIIKQKTEVTQQEIHQVRTQTTQGTNLNITIHISINFIQDKNKLIDMTKIEK
ncbi:hypothetical protein ABPG72_020042 [Tetrahymena utriculariae]